MSGIYDVTLAAGAVANIGVLGSYLKIRSAPYGLVRVKLDGGESYLLDEGLGLRLPDGMTFRDVSIRNESPTPQTILVFIGDTHFEDTRVSGVVSVSNKIGGNVQQFDVAANTAGGFVTTQLIAPTANPRGLIVRRAGVSATAGVGGTSEIRMIAAPVVPTTSVPANAFNMCATAGGASVPVSDFRNDLNYQLPATWGLWIVTVHLGASAAQAGASLIYETL